MPSRDCERDFEKPARASATYSNIRSLNIHTFSLKTHSSNISDLEEEIKKELINVNAVYQQSNKVMPQWKTIQDSVL